ncbi:MAG: hypothetical protein J6B89_03890 [Bacilli bacterium]|nr:hypothetical protein [Bacilli bacterium]
MKESQGTVKITSNNKKEITKVKININDNSIWYFEHDQLKTLALFNYKDFSLERDNKELYLKYYFKEGKETQNNTLQIKSLNQITNIPIYTKEIVTKNNYIKIVYSIEQDEFIYELSIEK